MKKVFVAFLSAAALLMGVCGLAACKDNAEKEHRFSSAWEYDDQRHWHACTVHPDCPEKDGTALHTPNAEGECTVCGYRSHVHAYVWEFDETTHRERASCHPDEVRSEGAHDFGTEGVCACGVTQAETEVYPVYAAFAAAKGDEAKSFEEWAKEVNGAGDTVRLNEGGDGVRTHGGSSEVLWFAARTVTVQAVCDAAPAANVWFKVCSKDGSVLATAATDGGGTAELTFVPVDGYSGADVSYTVVLAAGEDVTGGIPYPATYAPVGDFSAAVTVENAPAAQEPLGTASFEKVLKVGLANTNMQIGKGGYGDKATLKLSGVPAGIYSLTFTNVNGLVAKGALLISVGDEIYESYITAKGDAENGGGAATAMIYIPEGTQEIKTWVTNANDPRYATVALMSAGALSAQGTVPVLTTHGASEVHAVYPVSLPAGTYHVEATMYGSTDSGEDAAHALGALTLVAGETRTALTAGDHNEDYNNTNDYFRSSGDFTVTGETAELYFEGGTGYNHYATVSFTRIETATAGTPFTVNFAEGSRIYTFEAPEAGLYELTATADEAFGGVSVSDGASALLSAAGGQSSYSATFRAAAQQQFRFTLSHSGNPKPSVTFLIKKVEAGAENILTCNEAEEITLPAGGLAAYSFEAEEGFYFLKLSADNLAGLTVMNGIGENIAEAAGGTSYAVLDLTAGKHTFIFRYSGSGALTLQATVAQSEAKTLTVGSPLAVSFTAGGEVQFVNLKSDSSEVRIERTGDADVKIYNAHTGKLLAFEKEEMVATVGGDITLILVYEGEGAGSVTLTANIALAAPRVSGDGDDYRNHRVLSWDKIENAETYEIWLNEDDAGYAKVAEVSAAEAENSPKWEIPVKYWDTTYRAWKVKAVAANYLEGESNEVVTFYSAQMALINLTVKFPAGYNSDSEYRPKTFQFGIYKNGSMQDFKSVHISLNTALEENFRFFMEEAEYTIQPFGSAIEEGYEIVQDGTVSAGGYQEHVANVTFEVAKKGAEVTVTVNLPEGNAEKEGDEGINSVTVELWKSDSMVGSKTVGDLGGAASGTVIFKISEDGAYTLKVTAITGKGGGDVTGNFTATEAQVEISGTAPRTATIDLSAKQAGGPVNCTITVTVNIPADNDMQQDSSKKIIMVTVELWKDGVHYENTSQPILSFKDGKGTATFTVKEAGEYTVKVVSITTMDSGEGSAFESTEGSVTVTGNDPVSAEVTVSPKGSAPSEPVNCTITVTINLPADNDDQTDKYKVFSVTVELWKDGIKYNSSSQTIYSFNFQDGKATAEFTVQDAGEYTVKVVSVADSIDYFQPSSEFESTEDTVTVTGNDPVSAEVTVSRKA